MASAGLSSLEPDLTKCSFYAEEDEVPSVNAPGDDGASDDDAGSEKNATVSSLAAGVMYPCRICNTRLPGPESRPVQHRDQIVCQSCAATARIKGCE
jgi:hypothetical protein